MARKTKQRTPLYPADAPSSPSASSSSDPGTVSNTTATATGHSNRTSTASATISVNSSLHPSAIPSIPSSTTTSVTSIASIASIPSITSIASTSTVTPTSRGALQTQAQGPLQASQTAQGTRVLLSTPSPPPPAAKDSKLSAFRSRFTKSSPNNKNSSNSSTKANTNTNITTTNVINNRNIPATSPSPSTPSSITSSMVLPLSLPSFDDFGLLPFMDSTPDTTITTTTTTTAGTGTGTGTGTGIGARTGAGEAQTPKGPSLSPSFSPSPAPASTPSSPSFAPSPPSPHPPNALPTSSSSSSSRPVFTSSFSPSNSQYLTSQSSKVQDYKGPPRHTQHSSSSTSSRTPSMHTKTATFDATGPLDLSRLEAKDYFILNNSDSGNGHHRKHKSTTFTSSTDIRGSHSSPLPSDRGRGRPTSDDLLAPPRFVIRQPSLSNMSRTSRATSPSPSLTSSVFSDESSVHSSHHHQHTSIQQIQQQQQLTPPPKQQQQQQPAPSTPPTPSQQQRSRQESQPQPSRPPTRSSVASIPEQTKSSLSASSERAPSSRPTSPLPISPGSKRVTVLKSTSSTSGGSGGSDTDQQRTPSPNLRSRLSRLFRQSPKPEKVGPIIDQTRYRAEQQKLYQESLRSNAGAAKASEGAATAAIESTTVHTQNGAQINKQSRPEQQQLQQHQRQPPSPQQQLQQDQSMSRPVSPSGPALQFSIEEEEVMDDHEDEPAKSQGLREPTEHVEGDAEIRHNTHQSRDTPGATRLNIVPPITIPQTFAPGLNPSSPSSPMTRNAPAPGNKPRQRRVSSVSSTHSIRQVGSYGVSPARKANPYYGVIARYSNGNKIVHERDHSSSSLRRSNPGHDQTRKEKLEAAVETESPIIQGITLSSKDHVSAQEGKQELATDVPLVPVLFTAKYEEEYDIEKDESARSSLQGSPFQTLAVREASPGRILLHSLTPSLSNSAPLSGGISRSSDQHAEPTDDEQQPQKHTRPALPSPETTWSTATAALTDIGTIPDSLGSFRTESHRRGMDSFDSQASEATPSISTLSSAQVTNDFKDHSLQSGDRWDTSSQDHEPNPVLLVQRPSTEISILPETPFVQTRPLSDVSSIQSGNSNLPAQAQAMRLMSVAQWSESSYDPCAPIRWDELFEMDPNSKGPLWLSNRGLGQIPHEFFDGLRNLRELYLDHNDIKVVPDSLLKLTKLDVLDLSCNSISSFHSAFKMKKLKNLRRLNLDQNMLTDISPIYKLKSLRELRLNHNFVGHLAIAIQNMAKLKILTMESNSLVTLPETIGKLGNLCELRLSDNNLRALPESIGSMRTLQVLALRSNLLERLPESWKDLENLTTLDLACNRLTSLPQDLVRLPKLTHLDLHDNQIQALPDKIGQLSNLVVLHLCNNHLRELPKDIGRLRDLQDLILSFNFIQVLPDEIGKLNKLQELKFDNNPLRSLPKTIQRLVNVRRVHLQGCALRDLPVELGVAFKELTYLDLSGNQFEVMPPLDQMYKLEEFYISNNYLHEIGTSSLNLSNSNSNSNTYNGTLSGPVGGGLNMANNALVGSGSMSQNNSGGNSLRGGVTASKLSDLKRLRVFELHHNQIRVLSSKIKVLNHLEVLDLSDNMLSWLPKEVGDLAQLKVLLLKGNPIKSLPSSLTKLMGSLEVFRIGEWPENGFQITREQHQMNMKINVLQSFMPQQIERTLLWRMHDSILRRVQELDSQQYRDQHDLDGVTGAGPVSRALTTGFVSPRGTTLALSASTTNAPNSKHLGISQGLAIATQNMMVNRSFALPPVSGGENDSITTTSSVDPKTEMQSLNSEGINPNYVDYPTIRTLPTLQFSSVAKHNSPPITSQPLTTSPSSTSPSGSLSAFPLLNSLRPRKSQQQLARNNGLGSGLGADLNALSRPKSMYTHTSPHQQEQQQHPQILQKLNNRMSRVFEFATGSKATLDIPHSSSTLESSTLQLSSDAMMALGLETNPGSAGSVIRHNNGGDRVTFARGGRLGNGSLSDIKYSLAIKSSPSLTSTPMTLFSPRATSPTAGTTSSMSANSGRPSTKASKTSFGRSVSPLPSLVSEKSTTSLPWLRLRTSSSSPVSELPQTDDYPASLHTGSNTLSAASLLLRQPSLTENLLNAPTPPPILLDYDLNTDASLDIPSHMYYSAGGDDVDGDRPVGEDGGSSVLGDGLGIDGESDEEDDHSTTTGGGRSRGSFSGKSRRSKDYQRQQQQQQQQQNLNSTDPVLKIAVLKGIYDQILQNMDQMAEHNIQESPAKKNNRFKLLNSLKFLKNQSNSSGGGGGSGYHTHRVSGSMGHITAALQ